MRGSPYRPSFILPIIGANHPFWRRLRPPWRRRRGRNRRQYWGMVPPQAAIDSHRNVKQRWHRQTLAVAPGRRRSMVHHDRRHHVTVRRKRVILVMEMLMANDRRGQRGRFAGAIDELQGRHMQRQGLPERRQVVARRWAD